MATTVSQEQQHAATAENVRAEAKQDEVRKLELIIVSYKSLMAGDAATFDQVRKALAVDGIIGVRDIPNFTDNVSAFIAAAREFGDLTDTQKKAYAADRDTADFLGFEPGTERFQNKDGVWHTDESKHSYYGLVPDVPKNKWPTEVNLQKPFQDLGNLMVNTGRELLRVALNAEQFGRVEPIFGLGRLLNYREPKVDSENPLWCGRHFDHGMFTSLIPAYYYRNGERIPEPEEAGLSVFPLHDKSRPYKVSNPGDDVLLFQVGETARLLSNDAMIATSHYVAKPRDLTISRFALAVFLCPPEETDVTSTSELTRMPEDDRYRRIEAKGDITYGAWHMASVGRYYREER